MRNSKRSRNVTAKTDSMASSSGPERGELSPTAAGVMALTASTGQIRLQSACHEGNGCERKRTR